MKKIFTDEMDFHLSDSLKQDIEIQVLREKMIHATKEELYCKGRYKNFFENYDEETIHAFIDEYAKKKTHYLLNGDKLISEEENCQLYFRNLAETLIWEIQQKKLFDLQCLWRAEKIKIESIKVTRDFEYLESSIKNCNLIDAIDRDELQLYLDYILSDDYSDEKKYTRWQDYDAIKCYSLQLLPDSIIPEWYLYHYKMTESQNLLDLPDIKGEKELHYLEILRKEKLHMQNHDQINHDAQSETKLPLAINYKTFEFFISTFEDKSLLKYFHAAEKFHPDLNKNSELDEALYILRIADEKVPVITNRNWKDGVIEAAKYFKTKKVAEALLVLFDEYTMRIKTNLPFNDGAETTRQQLILRNVDNYKKQILKARELKGEAADFNY